MDTAYQTVGRSLRYIGGQFYNRSWLPVYMPLTEREKDTYIALVARFEQQVRRPLSLWELQTISERVG